MQTAPQPTNYGGVAQSFHWVVAALVVLQFLLAPIPENLPPGFHVNPPFGLDKPGLLARHKSFGMTVLMLMMARALWRWRNAPPDLPETMKPALRFLARAAHLAFYVILIAMPLSGWMMSSARGASVRWFGLWTWPSLIGQKRARIPPVARDARYAESDPPRACLVTRSCGAQTSFLEQGRRADADAIFRSFREMNLPVKASWQPQVPPTV
jgi:cytochrome b561